MVWSCNTPGSSGSCIDRKNPNIQDYFLGVSWRKLIDCGKHFSHASRLEAWLKLASTMQCSKECPFELGSKLRKSGNRWLVRRPGVKAQSATDCVFTPGHLAGTPIEPRPQTPMAPIDSLSMNNHRECPRCCQTRRATQCCVTLLLSVHPNRKYYLGKSP